MSEWISKRQMVDKIEDLFLDKYEAKANSDLTEFYKEVLKILVNAKGQSGWISVEDQLPEIYTEVAVIYHETSDVNSYAIAFCNVFNKWSCDLLPFYLPNVTHWMPLPQKPESEE